ncbi:glycosyltransferase involved in cell wall biosynthesis [Nocardioides panaciterrulae]|uniref:Glycosyltransferase involved in cell wall biosynthesis n=2 Tax=Nocardioides panaciterrulae TaxID=661492 RepID=A0A7Y9J9E1_9ACTN|nr:glycosyltransferase involved in cell wall biosynthesis [Nocardioides panaciterrulae]
MTTSGRRAMDDLFIILSPTASGNALGRALSMALVARELGECRLFAPESSSRWLPAAQFPVAVDDLPSPNLFGKRVRDWSHDRRIVVWSCKSISPLPRYLRALRRAVPEDRLCVVVDFDDDDAGLAEMFVARSVRNAVKLNRLRSGSATRIRRAQRRAVRVANARSVATWALGPHVPGNHLPSVRIPHVRHRMLVGHPSFSRDRPIRVGFLGTWRAHKGGDALMRLAETKGFKLVTFSQKGVVAAPGLEVLDPSTPLSAAYSRIDVLALPMSTDPASLRQLPAKLVDAFSAGVPVVATPTPAITEIAGTAITYLDDWTDITQVQRVMREAVSDYSKVRMEVVWRERLSPGEVSKQLSLLLAKTRSAACGNT